MEVVIVRTSKRYSGDPYTAPAGTLSHDPEELSIEVADLVPSELNDLRHDPTVLGNAPRMTTQLIEPFSAAAGSSASPPPVSWGVRAVGAEESDFTGAGVTVAILDTGIDQTHRAFSGVRIVQENFTKDVDHDEHGHGTHCAGTIFGRTTDGCRIGVAPGVQTALIGKVLGKDGGFSDAIFRAVLWAQKMEAHVISMSLGIDFTGYQKKLATFMQQEVATSLALTGLMANVRLFDSLSTVTKGRDQIAQGVVVVAASGNESRRNVNKDFRISTSLPAAAEHFLSVAALGESGDADHPLSIAPFSNIYAKLAAPGVEIWSAKRGGTGDGLTRFSGTSMATPHVAGVAALWAEMLMTSSRFSATRVAKALVRTATRLPYLDADDVGAGLVRAPRKSDWQDGLVSF
jgi:subtilisin family serine protease